AGKFHVLGGQPGTGKTTIALDFAAIVSSGGRWPDGARAEAGNVLIWSGEDDAEDVLASRLEAMGADMTRIFFVGPVRRGMESASFDPACDLPALERKAETIGVCGGGRQSQERRDAPFPTTACEPRSAAGLRRTRYHALLQGDWRAGAN